MQREKEIHRIEVHVAAMCFKKEKKGVKVLIGKRAKDRHIFPCYWECGGGQVHAAETFIEAVEFHMKEEFGLKVNVLFPFCTYRIDLKSKMIPGIRFICTPKKGSAVKIDMEEIVDYKWVDIDELGKYKLIPGLKEKIILGYKYYSIFKKLQLKRSAI